MKNIVYIEANCDGTIGGSYYCLLEIVKHVDRKKYNPIVVFYGDNTLVPEFRKYSEVIILRNTKGLVLKRDYPRLYNYAGRNRFLKSALAVCQKMYNLVRYDVPFYSGVLHIMMKYKIDLVHMNDAPFLTDWLIASKLFRAKCVSHVRGNWAPRPLERRLLKYYERIISISNSVTNFIKGQRIDTGNFVTIHDGIDIHGVLNMKNSDSEALRKEFARAEDTCLVGLIGNVKQWKGQHVAVEAMKILKERHPNVKCLIIGDVSNLAGDRAYYGRLRNMVSDYDLHDQVVFTGFRSDIPDLISAVDIVIHTSTVPEPFGRVVLEGMLFSKPVIATAHGGPVEIIEDGISGFLVPPADPQALADSIQRLLTDHDARRAVGTAARKRVERLFTIEANVKAIENVYASIFDAEK